MGRSPLMLAAAVVLMVFVPGGALAQTADVAEARATVGTVIPQQVRYTGALANRNGETVEAVFSIYASAEGGEALWTETQRVAVGADGSYTVVLGAASEKGLPQAVFAGGQARWVGVTLDRMELARSPLASVAYAMKAGDAETVGGLVSSILATKDDLAKLAQTDAAAIQAQSLVLSGIHPEVTPTGTGTMNYVPLWTASGNLGNSGIYQATNGFTGIGTTTPGGPLQVSTGAVGGANATLMLTQTNAASGNYYADIGLYNSYGLIGNLSALGAGYPAGNLFGANDVVFLGGQQKDTTNLIFLTNTNGALKFGTGGFAISNERMRIGVAGGVSVGNSYVATDPGAGNMIVSGKLGVGTKTPAAVLEVNGTAKFDGLATFAAGQTFPGTGTITGITTTSPLTGSGTTGSVALGFSTTALETTLNPVYAQLGAADTFAGAATFNKGLIAHAVSGSMGVLGTSDSSYGVQGTSTTGIGVGGQATQAAGGSAGVLGYTNNAFSATYKREQPYLSAGVWADTSSSTAVDPVALVATADNAYGAVIYTSGAEFEAFAAINTNGMGAYIESDTAGDGLDVYANAGDGVYASANGSGSGVHGVAYTSTKGYAGVTGMNNGASAVGQGYEVYGGVWGDTAVDASMIGSYFTAGLYGSTDNGRAGVFLNNSASYPTLYLQNLGSGSTQIKTGLFGTLMATSATGTCGIDGGSMSCTGPIKSLASAGGSRMVETYAVQSPENWMEDFGSGSVVNGHASITLDPAFAETVSGDGSYKVFLTPNGDSKGLYVTAKTANGFEVRESGGGTSSLSFDYRIVAKRAGYEAQRMPDVTEAFAGEMGRSHLAKSEVVQPLVEKKRPSLPQGLGTPHRMTVPGKAPQTVLPRANQVSIR